MQFFCWLVRYWKLVFILSLCCRHICSFRGCRVFLDRAPLSPLMLFSFPSHELLLCISDSCAKDFYFFINLTKSGAKVRSLRKRATGHSGKTSARALTRSRHFRGRAQAERLDSRETIREKMVAI